MKHVRNQRIDWFVRQTELMTSEHQQTDDTKKTELISDILKLQSNLRDKYDSVQSLKAEAQKLQDENTLLTQYLQNIRSAPAPSTSQASTGQPTQSQKQNTWVSRIFGGK